MSEKKTAVDALEVVAALREIMTGFDSARYSIEPSFGSFGPEVEALAAKAREASTRGAEALFMFLERLESHPEVVAAQHARTGTKRKKAV
jgi:hypothetical protein